MDIRILLFRGIGAPTSGILENPVSRILVFMWFLFFGPL